MEEYFCEICDKHIIIQCKSKHLKSKSHVEKSKSHQFILSLKNVNTDEVDELYNLYLIEHKKKDFYGIKRRLKLVLHNGQYSKNVRAKLASIRTPIWWK